MKKYIKPELECIEFIIDDEITDIFDGKLSTETGEDDWGN